MRARLIRIVVWILLGLALRGFALGGDGLWCDEGFTAWTSHLSAEEHAIARQNDDAPPLYYALQRWIVPHLPPGEGSVRLLSAAAGVAGVVWLAVQPPFGTAAEAPAAFLALGTYGVYYGRQARSYALLILWSLVLMTATSRVLDRKRRWLPIVVLAELLALWTHNVGAALVVGANLAWLLCGRTDPIRWIGSQIVTFLLWIPYLVHASPQFAVHAKMNVWIGDFWQKVPLAFAPLLSLASFTSGARVAPSPPVERWDYSGPGSILLALWAFAAVAFLLLSAFRRGSRREALFAASFTLGPLLSLTILSIVAAPSYILARTDAVAYGGFLLWTALGLRGTPKLGRPIVLAILAGMTLLATASHFPIRRHERGNDRIVGERLRRELHPADWVAFVGLSRPSIDYYLSGGRPGRPDPSLRRISYPASTGANPAAVYPTPGESLRTWEAEALDLRRRFETTADDPGEAFFYVGPISPSQTDSLTAADLPYPGNLLAYALNGLRPLEPIVRRRGDGMGIDWIALRVSREQLIPIDQLQPVEEVR